MVNWNDPAVLLNDYFAYAKLSHAFAGLYIWELLVTAGFELDVLRGKRPYRWTIWLYLGTRYTGLLVFIFLFLSIDGAKVPCHPIVVTAFASAFASLAFASLIIVLRVIAIWNRNIIVSSIAIGAWLAALALNIRHLTLIDPVYNSIVDVCVILHTENGLLNATGVLVADAVLLLTMFIGLLRHPHRSSTGIWKFLYRQCIIWMVLAMIAEIPLVVFLILNLNDVLNQMFLMPAVSMLSIGAARMYRSLSDRGSFTECVSSDLPRFVSVSSIPGTQCRGASIHFASFAQSYGTRTMGSAPPFLPADQVRVEFVPGRSTSSFARESTEDKVVPTRYETA